MLGIFFWDTVSDFTFWLKTFAEPFRWAKAKAERWSLYLDQSSTKWLKMAENW